MIRKLLFATTVAGITLASTWSYSEPLCRVAATVHPCDVVCEAPGATEETVCDCPCWTDRRVPQTTCDRWNGVAGCWWL
jgi:hypothetical protein